VSERIISGTILSQILSQPSARLGWSGTTWDWHGCPLLMDHGGLRLRLRPGTSFLGLAGIGGGASGCSWGCAAECADQPGQALGAVVAAENPNEPGEGGEDGDGQGRGCFPAADDEPVTVTAAVSTVLYARLRAAAGRYGGYGEPSYPEYNLGGEGESFAPGG